MFRVLNCLGTEHDWRLVVLAAVVCFLTSLAAVSLFHRARALDGRSRVGWLLTAGAATGSGVWATHFIAVLAFDPGYTVAFDIVLTILSLFVGIAVVTVGLALAVYGQAKWNAAAGGVVVGIGISSMHYVGMSALEVAGIILWATDLVIASIIFGAVFGAAALHLAVRDQTSRALIFGALVLTLAIVSMHFTAMGAVGILPSTGYTIGPNAFSNTSLSLAIAAVAAGVLGMCMVGAWTDRRNRQLIAEQNKRLDGALNNMNQGLCMFDAENRLVVWNNRYIKMYKIDPKRVWVGCTIRDLLDARIAAGTFPLDPERYDCQLRASLKTGQGLTMNIELADGRIIAVANQPIAGGGWVATHEDITERTEAMHELSRTRSFLDKIISNVPTPIVVKQLSDFKYLLVNKAAEKLFCTKSVDMVGKTAHEVFSKAAAESVHEHDLELLRAGREIFFDEHSMITPDGDCRIVTTTRIPVDGDDGKPQYMIGVIHDVTQRKRDEARISYMAHHDPLTDLPNRSAFNQCLEATLEQAARAGERFGVLCIDLDRFKEINDVFGHSAGDDMLRQVAKRLEEACQGAFLARVGGDEFIAVTPSGEQPATAEMLAERLNQAVGTDIEIAGHPLRVGLTIGVSIYPNDGGDAATLVANADAALYRAKDEARGSIRFFELDMDKRLREKRALQHDLRSAIADDQLELYYQPQALISGEIIGFEALARWHHPQHGVVSPGSFIPLAEESGLIISLGEWILRKACGEAAAWERNLSIAVNLSPVQFQHGDLASVVHEILLETGLAPGRLELEITEGVLIGDFGRAVSILRRLKNLGVRIAMDDFGTGYSSLSYLQSFPFDKIKIDQAFISNLGHSQQSVAIIRAVIGLGRGLELPVVAEGVETEEQLAFLARESCNEIQGYIIGRPKPIADYAAQVGRAPAAAKSRAKANGKADKPAIALAG